MEDDLRLNLFSNIDIENEPNTSEILQLFDRFFFAFGRFPAINELIVVPAGDVSVLFNQVMSSSHLLNCIKKI